MSRSITLAQIIDVLEKCAPGYGIRRSHHRQVVEFNRRVYMLPKGAHGDRRSLIEVGHVRRLVASLEIGDCIKKEFSGLLG